MSGALKNMIVEELNGQVGAIGFAPLERFGGAPEKHHPSRVCEGAETVIVFGNLMPRGVLSSPDYSLYLLHRSYHTLYPQLNELGLRLANFIESQGFPTVQIPAYAPLVYRGPEPWGIISLKHAAAAAGLGAFGRNELVYHPHHGSFLRYGAVITGARLPGDPIMEHDPCPEDCCSCQEVCPAAAFENGSFNKMDCLLHTIRHGIYPLALKDEIGRKNIETIINTAGYDYWIKCAECMRVCPNNQAKPPINDT